MSRTDIIISDKRFQEAIKAISDAEKDRIYCLHNLEHSVDVARICYILSLESNMNIKKDVIYAAALLHDIGRFKQYQSGIPHQLSSMEIAKELLPKAGYTEDEAKEIILAIDCHRNGATKNRLGAILQKADNLSRLCFDCKAKDTCKWSSDEMNTELIY